MDLFIVRQTAKRFQLGLCARKGERIAACFGGLRNARKKVPDAVGREID